VTREPWLLALDTATDTIVVAAGTVSGGVLATDAFEGRYRHSQELLPAVVRLTEGAGLTLGTLAGVIVGTGPGAFTGLRVGLATAKTLAHELARPIVGIPTGDALLAAVDGAAALWLPAGTRDRVLVTPGATPLVIHGDEAPDVPGPEIAVDLDGRAPDAASQLGRRAVDGLAASLLQLGAARLARGESDDPERLVPGYASPPRGAPAPGTDETMAWSRDPR
jgi:tRNA threonylcarbamoyl adenosine modification protein YeaZ